MFFQRGRPHGQQRRAPPSRYFQPPKKGCGTVKPNSWVDIDPKFLKLPFPLLGRLKGVYTIWQSRTQNQQRSRT